MSEDRTKKDPLLGGLDGMRAGQHWEGEPESLRHPENCRCRRMLCRKST